MTHHWSEDELTPREDVLTADFGDESPILPVAHPEWFRVGDVVRVGADDLYFTGEKDQWGNPIMRARNEAVKVVDVSVMEVVRAIGVNPPQFKPQGERVFIIGTAAIA